MPTSLHNNISSFCLDIRNNFLHLRKSIQRQDVQVPLSLQEVGWENTTGIGAADEIRCNFTCDGIATINAKGSSQKAQPIQARDGAIKQHLIVQLTYPGVGPPALISCVCISVVFDFRDENWFLVLIQNNHEDKKVHGVTRRIFIGGGLQGKEEGEGAFNQGVVEEPVIRAVIARLEWHGSVATDIENVE